MLIWTCMYTALYTYLQQAALLTWGAPAPSHSPPLAPPAVNKAGISINTVQVGSSWCLKLCLANAWLNDLKFPRVLL